MNASNVTGAKSAATAAKNKIAQDLLAQISGIDTNQAQEDERLKQLLITLGVNPTPAPPPPPVDDSAFPEIPADVLAQLQISLAGLGNLGQGFLVR